MRIAFNLDGLREDGSLILERTDTIQCVAA
jgi:hypothetical protein